jgi:predicted RNA binding protein YcfA (HicA-like mRNA interferase family)
VPRIPGVNHQDAVRALQKAGFRIARQGKHTVMTDGVRIITIPRHNPVNAFTGLGERLYRRRLPDRLAGACARSQRSASGVASHAAPCSRS